MPDDADSANILDLATELTVAWLSNPNTKISADELPNAIQKIHSALVGLSAGPAEVEAAPEYTGAVSSRKSLASPDHLISMIDGKPYKMLKRHLAQNGLTPAEYRERYGLRPDYPMVAEAYSEKRRNLAKSIGLGRKPGERPGQKPAAKPPAAKPARAARKPAVAKAPAKASATVTAAPVGGNDDNQP